MNLPGTTFLLINGTLVSILDLFDARQVLKNSKLINNNEVSKSFKNGRLWPFCKVKCPILGVKLRTCKKRKKFEKNGHFWQIVNPTARQNGEK